MYPTEILVGVGDDIPPGVVIWEEDPQGELQNSKGFHKVAKVCTDIILCHVYNVRIINPPLSNLVICLNRESIQSIFSH